MGGAVPAFTFYNVPILPGVPAMIRNPAQVFSLPAFPVALAAALAADLLNAVSWQWGIYLDGAPIIATLSSPVSGTQTVCDSVIAFSYRQDYSILDYPVEDGAFATYNKVFIPFDVRIRFSKGGTTADRKALLDAVQNAAGTQDQPNLSLYDVVTPEETYQNCNIVHWGYERTSRNGVGLLLVDVWLRQVNVSAVDEFSTTGIPSGTDATSDGLVQALPAPASISPQSFQLPVP